MADITFSDSGKVSISGEIDMASVAYLKPELEGFVSTKPKKVVIDLSDTSYIESAGLAMLIGAMQEVKDGGGSFSLCGLKPSVRSVFEISRLDTVFLIFHDCDEAFK